MTQSSSSSTAPPAGTECMKSELTSPGSYASITPSVEDHIEVGSVEILASPHVSEGPGRIAKAPVPSIYVDDRGDIHRLRIGGNRINLLYSKKSVMRSGYFHPHITHDFIVSGQVEVWTLGLQGTVKTIYNAQEYFPIPPYVPHILYFLQDTVLVEWYEKNVEFQCYYYHPYRKIVDIQNSISYADRTTGGCNTDGTGTPTGRHQRLVPQDDVLTAPSGGWGSGTGGGSGFSTVATSSTSFKIMSFLSTSLVVLSVSTFTFVAGIAVGIVLGANNDSGNTSKAGATLST